MSDWLGAGNAAIRILSRMRSRPVSKSDRENKMYFMC
jgi:hypothetical protein